MENCKDKTCHFYDNEYDYNCVESEIFGNDVTNFDCYVKESDNEKINDDISSFADKIENVQHITTKNAIINYLLTENIISVGHYSYKEIMSIDKSGCVKKQY